GRRGRIPRSGPAVTRTRGKLTTRDAPRALPRSTGYPGPMANPRHLRELTDLARELDLVVYRLERPSEGLDRGEMQRLRRELERLRDGLGDLLRELGCASGAGRPQPHPAAGEPAVPGTAFEIAAGRRPVGVDGAAEGLLSAVSAQGHAAGAAGGGHPAQVAP